MIRFRRELALGSRASRRYVAMASPLARAYVIESRGLVHDSCVAAPSVELAVPNRYNLAVVLAGRYLLRRGERWVELGPGDVVHELAVGRERWLGNPFSLLVLEWVAQTDVPVWSLGRLGPSELALAKEARDALLAGSDDVSRVRQLARLIGLSDMNDQLELDERAPRAASLQPAALALSHAMSNLDGAPAWTDLERDLGRSERQGRRLLQPALSILTGRDIPFRSYLRMTKLALAAELLTVEGIAIGEVARRVGYGSSRAFGKALEQVGMPSATELRSAIVRGHRRCI